MLSVRPPVHHRGVHCHSHLALAWAAKKGISTTLTKALAAGASPNYVFHLEVKDETWGLLGQVENAAKAWRNQDPNYWLAITASSELIYRDLFVGNGRRR